MSQGRSGGQALDAGRGIEPLGTPALLSSLREELGPELFELLLRHGDGDEPTRDGSPGAGDVLPVLAEWTQRMACAGWGAIHVLELDFAAGTARLRADDPFELRTGSADSAGEDPCPLLAGLVTRTMSRLFGRRVAVQITGTLASPASLAFHVVPDTASTCERLRALRQQRDSAGDSRDTTPEGSEARTRELLRQRTRALRAEIVAREEAERAKDDMLATVSHELRTPLTSLRGFAELMRDRDLPPETQRRCVQIIHDESLRLAQLIDDFLDLQTIERGKDNTVMLPEDVVSILVAAAELHSTRSHRVRVSTPAEVPRVMADARRVRQVLSNLLSNAIKFSPGKDTVDVCLEVRDEDVAVRVRDHGIGIPADAVAKLFTKFYRVDNKETRSIGGTGLGLAITKQIVERHGGTVSVESVLGEGTTFSFTLLRVQPRA